MTDTEEASTEKQPASDEARRIIGAFSSPADAALMDEVLELVMRERRNAQPPRDMAAE